MRERKENKNNLQGLDLSTCIPFIKMEKTVGDHAVRKGEQVKSSILEMLSLRYITGTVMWVFDCGTQGESWARAINLGGINVHNSWQENIDRNESGLDSGPGACMSS